MNRLSRQRHPRQSHRDFPALTVQARPGIGDMVWFLPALRAVARAEGATAQRPMPILTKMPLGAASLFEEDPFRFIPMPRRFWGRSAPARLAWCTARFGMMRSLQRLYVMHDSPWYALAGRWAGVPQRFGLFSTGRPHAALTVGLAMPKGPEIDEMLALPVQSQNLVRRLGIPIDESVPRLRIKPARREQIAQRLADMPRPWIIFGIAASEDWKIWPPEHFAALADALMPRQGTIFLLSGPDGVERAGRIKAQSSHPHLVAINDWALPDSAALIESADLFIGNDTGPANIAAALDRPSLVLFGKTLSFSMLYGKHVRSLYATDADKSMVSISPAHVLAELESLIHGKGAFLTPHFDANKAR
ncbi:MAG: glycosyltransferase family 9 protein [Alphaproteobacteria bacterium]|nr:MAG: glycosyltransferase family 9 protein [Alphaproteobacteria bacterium]